VVVIIFLVIKATMANNVSVKVDDYIRAVVEITEWNKVVMARKKKLSKSTTNTPKGEASE